MLNNGLYRKSLAFRGQGHPLIQCYEGKDFRSFPGHHQGGCKLQRIS